MMPATDANLEALESQLRAYAAGDAAAPFNLVRVACLVLWGEAQMKGTVLTACWLSGGVLNGACM
jgi:hypothetical protein